MPKEYRKLLNSKYESYSYQYLLKDKESNKDSGLTAVLDEPVPGELIDEPIPEVIDDCCCPCPPKTTAIPFVAFGPLQ